MAPQVPFIGNSSYKDQYKPYVIKPTEGNPEEKLLLKSKNHLADYLPPIKFEGISAYKLSYVPHTPEVHSMKEATHVALQKP